MSRTTGTAGAAPSHGNRWPRAGLPGHRLAATWPSRLPRHRDLGPGTDSSFQKSRTKAQSSAQTGRSGLNYARIFPAPHKSRITIPGSYSGHQKVRRRSRISPRIRSARTSMVPRLGLAAAGRGQHYLYGSSLVQLGEILELAAIDLREAVGRVGLASAVGRSGPSERIASLIGPPGRQQRIRVGVEEPSRPGA